MKPSHLSIQAKLSKEFLQKTIEKEIRTLIGKNGITIELPQGELHIEAIENLQYLVSSRDIQLSADIALEYSKEEGIDITGQGNIRLLFSIEYVISPEFILETKTKLANHEWLEKPSVKVGRLSIPSKGALDLMINSFDDEFGRRIDAIIKEKLDLQKLVTSQLAKLENPIPNPLDNNIHLFIDPQNLLFNIKEQENDYRLAVHISFGSKLEWQPQANQKIFSALPKIEEFDGTATMSQLHVPLKVNYDSLAAMLMKQFAEVEVIGRKLLIKDIQLSYDSRFRIKAEIEGDVSGTLQADTMPRLDAANQVLYLEELNYDISSKNFLVKAATFLAKSEIDKRIDQFSEIALTPIITPILASLNTKLTEFKIEGFDFKMKLDSLEVDKLEFFSDHLIATVNIKANESLDKGNPV